MSSDQPRSDARGLATAVVTCCGVGALVVGLTLGAGRDGATDTGAIPEIATEEYGRRLLTNTPALLGPDHANPEMRYSGSRMSCSSCHLGVGTDPGTLALLESAERYPRFSGRDGGMRDLLDRINGCMQRSMNGRPLPRDSAEMIAMAAYVRSLGDRYAAMGAGQREADEPPPFVMPDRAASVDAGEQVFEERCAICHGGDGSGLRATADPADGYVFPPLWGLTASTTAPACTAS